jgi:hypothetical protein
MSVPLKYVHTSVPVKFFLTSYRALSDGQSGIRHLEEYLRSSSFLLSDWKVIWIGACTLLRTSIELFQVDAKSCINQRIGEQLNAEWQSIKKNKVEHPIFWEFLRKERNNIIHEYEWSAYSVWMDKEGVELPDRIALLNLKPKDAEAVLVMRGGIYEGRDSLELLKESAEWVEARIFGAIRNAGFDPEENKNVVNF